MKHHIMLLFLSDVKLTEDGSVKETTYVDGSVQRNTQTTNESAVWYMIQHQHYVLSKVFVLATQLVRNGIIASKNVSECAAEGKGYTHLQYFKERIRDLLPLGTDMDNFIVECPCDDAISVSKSMKTVVELAKLIQEYIKNNIPKKDTVVLHADCTGGQRHVIMIMLAVMRLIQDNKRIFVGDVLYSNYTRRTNTGTVENARDIYQLYDLVAGAEEFTRFGSAQTIDAYYRDEKYKSPELSDLIESMNQFADAIKLCRYGEFTRAINRLKKSLLRFQEHVQDIEKNADHKGLGSLNDSLLGCLYGRFFQGYADILDLDSLDDINLIGWCLDHDYVQQALTLYVERVPEIVVRQQLIQLTKEGCEKLRQQRKRINGERQDSYILFNNFYDKSREDCFKQQFDERRSEYLQILVQIVKSDLKKQTVEECMKRIDEEEVNLQQLMRTKLPSMQPMEQIYIGDKQALRESLEIMSALYKNTKDALRRYQENPILQKILSLRAKATEEHFFDMPAEKMAKSLNRFLAGDFSKRHAADIFPNLTFAYARNIAWLHFMGWVQISIPENEIFNIINHYGEIKSERNNTNHAKIVSARPAVQEIKQLLRSSLNELEQTIKKYSDTK